jgi:Flp pilus assembly protein TadG
VKHHHERGAILVETTIVVTFMLTILLFAIELGLLGFLQVTADAAAFFDAHENIIGVTTSGETPEQATTKTFRGLDNTTVKPQVVPAPTPSVAVDYGYNSTDATEKQNSANNRHGGVALMQPVQLQSTVTNTKPLVITGRGISVTSQETEAKWTECGPHYNVVNEDYACGDASAPPNSAVQYSSAEYTPPYYVGYNFIERCSATQPWGDTTNGFAVNSTCPSGSQQLDALGMAEYLDKDNWNSTTPGMSGSAGSSVFQAMACHQRIYANLASFFQTYPTLSGVYAKYLSGIENQLGFTNGNHTFNDFRNWTAFDDNGGTGTTADKDIQSLYDWDVYIDTGYPPNTYKEPGTYPLNPLGNAPNATAGTQTAPVSC